MSEFQTHWVYPISNHWGYEIEVSDDWDGARVRMNYWQDDLDKQKPRRQEIKYDAKGMAYVTHYSRKLLLENFMIVMR